MPDVEVVVFREGREVDRVVRPLRMLADGRPAVTYRKQLRPLIHGGEVHLDGMGPAAPDPPPRDDGWDPLQAQVIFAASDARLLVSAGPGTGKTQVAAARVAHLISTGCVPASRIWLISFTRTAVKEMRVRIARALAEEGGVDAVKIATLDSHAWALHSGFDPSAEISGTHETNIAGVLRLIQDDPQVLEYLAQVGHLVVDEAQDIVGVRADLVSALIEALPPECGVTVFADEAQAIYGFAEDEEQREVTGSAPLIATLRGSGSFERCELRRVFRTESPSLLHIFTATRTSVLSGPGGTQGLRALREDVLAHADGEVPPDIREQGIAGRDDLFVLYRRRIDALIASSYLASAAVEHRLRLPGLPSAVHPWIGICLHDHLDARLGRNRFFDLWADRVEGTPWAQSSAEEAWSLLVEYAGESGTVVSLRRVREVLARSQPPAPFTAADVGATGPVVGTVHAAKGRESDHVHLMLPHRVEGTDPDEETRVVFVGATRARRALHVGTVPAAGFGKTTSGRLWRRLRDRGRFQVQLGLSGDLVGAGMASRSLFADEDHVHAVQVGLRQLGGFPLTAAAESAAELEWSYRLRLDEDGDELGFLAQAVNRDLFEIQRTLGGDARSPLSRHIRNLYVFGIRTVVVRAGSADAGVLHETWGRSGFMLAPLIVGFTALRTGSGERN